MQLDLTREELQFIFESVEKRFEECCTDGYPWGLLEKLGKRVDESKDNPKREITAEQGASMPLRWIEPSEIKMTEKGLGIK